MYNSTKKEMYHYLKPFADSLNVMLLQHYEHYGIRNEVAVTKIDKASNRKENLASTYSFSV